MSKVSQYVAFQSKGTRDFNLRQQRLILYDDSSSISLGDTCLYALLCSILIKEAYKFIVVRTSLFFFKNVLRVVFEIP